MYRQHREGCTENTEKDVQRTQKKIRKGCTDNPEKDGQATQRRMYRQHTERCTGKGRGTADHETIKKEAVQECSMFLGSFRPEVWSLKVLLNHDDWSWWRWKFDGGYIAA